MDQFVLSQLKSWKLENYIPVFEENEVDEEAFKCSTKEMIKSLIPKAGPQAKFIKYWTAEFDNVDRVASSKPNDKGSLDQSSDFQCLQDVLCNVSHISNFANLSATIPDFVPEDKIIEESLASTSSALYSEISQEAYSSLFTNITGPPSIASTGSSNLSSISNDTDIDRILRLTPEGIAVIRNYDRTRQLSPHNRLQLAGAIVAAELKGSTEFKLDKVTHKKILAKGKLYDKYVHYRSLLRRNGAIDTNQNHNTEDHRDKIQWLKNCIEPWSTVEDYWKLTSKPRIDELTATPDYTSVEYFSTFEALKQPLGYTLLSIDFAQIYPEKTLALYSEWETFQKEILSYCYQKKANDTHIQNLLSLIPAVSETETADKAGGEALSLVIPPAIALRILPLLLPCMTIKVAKKRAWRPSKVEIQSGFPLHVPSLSHLDTELTARKRKLLEHGLTEQPLAVIVGESILNNYECYVCINEVKYKVQSLLDAIDITFKSFYALQLQYPKEAELTWLLIQKRVYDITGECDKIIPSVSTLIADLRSC